MINKWIYCYIAVVEKNKLLTKNLIFMKIIYLCFRYQNETISNFSWLNFKSNKKKSNLLPVIFKSIKLLFFCCLTVSKKKKKQQHSCEMNKTNSKNYKQNKENNIKNEKKIRTLCIHISICKSKIKHH